MNGTVNRNGSDFTSADRAEWVARYRRSGLGLKAFAARNGLSAGRLHYWVYGARREQAAQPKAEPFFRELRIEGPLKANGFAAELTLKEGTVVRLNEQTDVNWAIALIQGLRQSCSR